MDIALLVGGRSTEHQFSIEMFDHFANHLATTDDDRIAVRRVVYVDRCGHVHRHEIDRRSDLPALVADLTCRFPADAIQLPIILKEDGLFVFSLIQGREGEDGQYQGMADLLEIPGNFGAVYPSAVGIDKWTFAVIGDQIGGGALRQIKTRVLDSNASDADLDEAVQAFAGSECVLKPNSLNGSLFMRAAARITAASLRQYLREVGEFDDRILVQERIYGREITCGCLRVAGTLRTLPVGEIVAAEKLFSYQVKYAGGAYEVAFPGASSGPLREVERVSLKLARFMGFHTLCRLDYIVNDQGIHLLEVNPSPGLLSESIFPRMLKKAGFSIVDLIVFSIENDARYRAARNHRNQRLANWQPESSDEENRPEPAQRVA